MVTVEDVRLALEATDLERDERWVVEAAFYDAVARAKGYEYADRWFISIRVN